MSDGWIKIHRSLMDWEWWDDSNTLFVWLTILLSVNHEPKRWHGVEIGAGEMVTSYAKLAEKCKLSVRSVRTALEHLKSTNEVTLTPTKHYTIISVVKWADYQCNDAPIDTQSDKQPTNKRQTADKQPTTNKNDKNVKKERNIFIPPTLDEVSAYCKERKNNINPQRFIDFYESKGWMVGKTKMKDWKASVRSWEQNQRDRKRTVIEAPQYIKDQIKDTSYDPEDLKWLVQE